MTDHQREACRPARPVPLMVVAGTVAPVQSYDGWLLPSGRLLSVPETLEFRQTCYDERREFLRSNDAAWGQVRNPIVAFTAIRPPFLPSWFSSSSPTLMCI
jgi:hypothetical protein